MEDFFPTMTLRPNESCEDRFCIQRQQEFKAKPTIKEILEVKEEKPLHEEDWGKHK